MFNLCTLLFDVCRLSSLDWKIDTVICNWRRHHNVDEWSNAGQDIVVTCSNIVASDRMSESNATVVFDWNSSSTVTPDDDCWMTLRCQLETTRFIVQKLIVPLVVAFGVLSNAVTVAVLTRPWMKSSTNSYLTALAVYDLLYLVFNSAVSLTVGWLPPVPPLRFWLSSLSVTVSVVDYVMDSQCREVTLGRRLHA